MASNKHQVTQLRDTCEQWLYDKFYIIPLHMAISKRLVIAQMLAAATVAMAAINLYHGLFG